MIPGGTEFMILDTVVVDGYFKLLKLSSERNHIGLGSLAETSVKKMKRESLGDMKLAHRYTGVDAAALQCHMFTCIRQTKKG